MNEFQIMVAKTALKNMFENKSYCPQCGTETEQLHEGYCKECCYDNQINLDRHNAEYDYWSRMDDVRREEAIRRGYAC